MKSAKIIYELWGVMIALFGDTWVRSFGEKIDQSGQWAETLRGLTRKQVADGIEAVRKSGRSWPPAAPEFRALCLNSGLALPTPAAAYGELHQYLIGRSKVEQLSPAVYHTIHCNMDFYQFKTLKLDKQVEIFKFAYMATVEQLNSGSPVYEPKRPFALLEEIETPVSAEQAEIERLRVLAMVSDTPEPKPLTAADIKDLEKLERIKSQ